jgi:hypothetical protein
MNDPADRNFNGVLKRIREYRTHLELDSLVELAGAITEAEIQKAKQDALDAVENGDPAVEEKEAI